MSDFEFLSVAFEYEGGRYYSLIRKKRKTGYTEYSITVMNGKLEKLLYGNHVVREVDGKLVSDKEPPNPTLVQLKRAIVVALDNHLTACRQNATAEQLAVRVNHRLG